MAKLTKERLEQVLSKRLDLRDPDFRLRKSGSRILGNIISQTFKGKRDHVRQEMIWDALEAELDPEYITQVGMLLAYTPDEWHIDDDVMPTPKRTKKAG
jgi:acid stress-induced BolA-like protein IbaG/YrbA